MNDDLTTPALSDPDKASSPSEHPGPSPKAAANRAGVRALLTLLIVALSMIGMVGIVAFVTLDGADWIAGLSRPPMVEVTGAVIFQGEPLRRATVSTQLEEGSLGLVTETDEFGEFTFHTEMGGKTLPGVVIGKHRVTVVGQAPTSGDKTPDQFASFESTPIRVEITKTSEHVVIKVDDYLGNPEEASANLLIEQIWARYDRNGDEKLDSEEVARVQEADYQFGLKRADTDGSGVVDAWELRAMVENFVRTQQPQGLFPSSDNSSSDPADKTPSDERQP